MVGNGRAARRGRDISTRQGFGETEYDDWGAHGGGQVYYLHLHAAKSVTHSGLSKRCLMRRLTGR